MSKAKSIRRWYVCTYFAVIQGDTQTWLRSCHFSLNLREDSELVMIWKDRVRPTGKNWTSCSEGFVQNQAGGGHWKAGVRFMNPWNGDGTLICPQGSTSLKEESKRWEMTESLPALKDYRREDCRGKNSNPRAATSYWLFYSTKQTILHHSQHQSVLIFLFQIICKFSSSTNPHCVPISIKKN